MKKQFIILFGIASAIGSAAHAEINHISECIGGTCPSNGYVRNSVVYANCTSSLCECVTAETSYALTCHCESDSDCDSGYGCKQGICQKCTTCSNCTSDTSYASFGTGYERKTIRTCSCQGTCSTSYVYRCAAGYWGASTNGTSGCTRCPASGGIYGTSDAGDNATQGKCYLSAGTSMSDSTGTFTCSDKSYYK